MNRLTSLLVLLSAVSVAGCSDSTLSQRTRGISDMGRMPLPNTAYQLHGYRLDNGISHDHFVYLVEDVEGRLVAGSLSNQEEKSGKSSHATAVNVEIAPRPMQDPPSSAAGRGSVQVKVTLTCDSVEQCERKLAAVRAAE
jgi:hypothetical protein